MYRVVIADDENGVRVALKLLIPWEEMELQLAAEYENGDELCAQAQSLKPEIIITDMRMPGISGGELIRRLHELLPDTQIIVVSGFDDYDYVREALRSRAVDYILKPVEEEALRTALGNAVRDLARRFEEKRRSRREVLNQLVHSDEPVSESEALKYLKESDRYCVIMVSLFEEKAAEAYAVRSVSGALYWEIVRLLQEDGIVFCDDLRRNTLCVIWYGGPEEGIRRIQERVPAVCGQVGVRPVLTAGEAFSEKRRIRRSYHQARTALESYDVLDGKGNAIYGKDTVQKNGWSLRKQTYDYLLKDGGIRELAVCRRCVQLFSEAWEKAEYVPFEALWDFVRDFTKALEPLVLDQTMDVTMTGLINLRERLLLRCSAADIGSDLEDFFSQTFTPGREGTGEYTGRAQKIKEYLEAHYREKLTLDDLASEFYLNKEYMSRMYRKEYGIRIGDYLDFLKMEEAKRLLLAGDRTIGEITEYLNFYDESHFNKKFKKAVGVTPKDYAKT